MNDTTTQNYNDVAKSLADFLQTDRPKVTMLAISSGAIRPCPRSGSQARHHALPKTTEVDIAQHPLQIILVDCVARDRTIATFEACSIRFGVPYDRADELMEFLDTTRRDGWGYASLAKLRSFNFVRMLK